MFSSNKHPRSSVIWPFLIATGAFLSLSISAFALDPHRALTQYTRTRWTQADGLPQDTIRAIAQTADGYLWLGTNEGLARFDGYDFVNYTKEGGALPSNAVGKLLATKDGGLWIGTAAGLSLYKAGKFTKFTAKDGMAPGTISSLDEDRRGTLWFVSGGRLNRYENGKFTVFLREAIAPVAQAQTVFVDARDHLWVGGDGGLVTGSSSHFEPVLNAKDMAGSFITSMTETPQGLWAGGTNGIFLIHPKGGWTHYTTNDGLSNSFVIALRQDREGNLWVGTYGGLSRLENGRFVSSTAQRDEDQDWVWSLYEDREGDLWVGMNAGLMRFRDDRFSNYGRPEGLPSDDPYVVHQDRRGVMWIGYHTSGLASMENGKIRSYTTRDGLASNEIFSIRSARNGDLLIGTRAGISRMRNGHFENQAVVDPLGRTVVYDALEDQQGSLWAATTRGVKKFDGHHWKVVIPDDGGTGYATALVTVKGGGGLWAGTLSSGVWHITETERRLYTTSDGLGSNQVRALYLDDDGTLWIGTLGGGLHALRNGKITRYEAKDGLLSNNIAHVEDDRRGALWLSTTSGISRIEKQQLRDFASGKISKLKPQNFGVADGLRSSQCAPAAPVSGGGTMSSDGRIWFPTSRGVAAINVSDTNTVRAVEAPMSSAAEPAVQLLGMEADGREVDLSKPVKLDPGTRRIQIRYAGIFLSAPERLQYAFRLDGVDRDWIPVGSRRLASYSPLPNGSYRFHVRAQVPGGAVSERDLEFEVQPYFYERAAFLAFVGILLALGAYGAYKLRLRRVHDRFALVVEERARLARELHDTLAQGLVGISAQLDVLAMTIDRDTRAAKSHLGLAQKMARHSLTEARRSVMDLRSADLEEQDLPAALQSSARRWSAGSAVDIQVEISGIDRRLPQDIEQNVFRIAQEAVANAVKHAGARLVRIRLRSEDQVLRLSIDDDGRGFAQPDTFSVFGGHFGILGMRERAERLRGEFVLVSNPGTGTQVEVTIPFEPSTTESRNPSLV